MSLSLQCQQKLLPDSLLLLLAQHWNASMEQRRHARLRGSGGEALEAL